LITVIAPHARPEFAANLLANFRRQRAVEALLVVVENGVAVGGEWPAGVVVLRSEPHQADAMNAGLKWLRANGNAPWARFDDDDYYSADYLADVETGLWMYPVVGKTWGFVLFDDGLYRFGGAQHGHAQTLTGGTLAAQSADVVPFGRFADDDVQWCRDMRQSGVDLWATEHRGYCYDRRSRNAPRVITTGPVVTRWGFGAAEYHGTVGPEYVDAPGAPRRCVSRPTDSDLLAEMCG
jgi:hypothetical protein